MPDWLISKWTLLVPALFGAAGIGGLLTKLLDFRLQTRKQSDGVAMGLVTQLTDRIARLEKRLDDQGKRHDAHIEIIRLLHEGEIALLRHRLGGEEQVNLALMTVLKTLDVPERALRAIDETRARKEEAIAREQAELMLMRATAVEKLAMLAKADQ